MTDPVKHCEVYKKEGCAHVDGFLCDMETCSIRHAFRPVIHHAPAAFQIHEKYMEGIRNGADAMAREIDRELLENIRAGVEQNTDDHCGYSEGTREAYEEFVKKRNYKIGGDL